MASTISSFLFIKALIIISCFERLSLSNAVHDDNPARLVSNDLHDMEPSDIVSISHDHISRFLSRRSNSRGRPAPAQDTVSQLFSVDSIYQFGDSLSDVGNFKWENPYTSFAQSPYGVTYFHTPTGRPSDGRLIVDYLAEYFRLPFIEPYLNTSGNFKQGVNFAVIGATALNVSALIAKGIVPTVTNHSLSVQVNWFKSHLASICSCPLECRRKLWRAAFIVGEIGGNDYNFATSLGKAPEIMYQMVPEVVQGISNAVEELIHLGARLIIIPGNILPGCMTVYLAGSNSNDPNIYDELKCIKSLNDLSKFHNDQLRLAITILQLKHPLVIILYMDLEGSMRKILQKPIAYGFDKDVVYKTCCGIGNDGYNFNYNSICGMKGVPVCEHPEKRVNWDGWHLTSHVYEVIVKQHFGYNGETFGDFSSVFHKN
ncbi:GDSL esterase/lipase At5g45910-like [Silene latifolia]|uniref:GDSL esterase/lipase At5g45910-like n=1 Tax=Silene latifolia TaxID=37657 RepID=UPI003D77ED0E